MNLQPDLTEDAIRAFVADLKAKQMLVRIADLDCIQVTTEADGRRTVVAIGKDGRRWPQ